MKYWGRAGKKGRRKMKAKRILAMLMAGALLLGTAAGCGSSGTTSSTSGGTDSTTTGGTTDNTDNGGKSDAKLTIWVYGWEKEIGRAHV